tara:strand:+ start:2802 stop:3743 length:942 start_codon:yes stop_codon:yes gene_type:complete
MEEEWLLINFQELVKSILNGERCIQEPIEIANKRRDTSSKVSFLNHLLSYHNINKDNILEIIASIHKRFLDLINSLKKNEIIQVMMDRINSEWYDPDYIFQIDNPFPDDFFEINNQNSDYYNRSCKVCQEIERLMKIENNIPLRLSKGESHPLEKHFHSGIDICTEAIHYLDENCKVIQSIIDTLKNMNMTQMIDLSIKHKSLYLKLSEKNDDENSVPENIHRIFSNYIHLHNLLLKQMIQYYHYLLHLLDELKERCYALNTMKQNVTSIAYFEDEEGDEEEEEDEGDTLTVVDGEVQKEGGNNVLDKLSSFF